MAKSNAERQAAYRQRRASERVTEDELQSMLYWAYCVGRMDEFHKAEHKGHSAVYAATMDRQVAFDLEQGLDYGFDVRDALVARWRAGA